jgi:uncharacterized protein (DUF608 family)
MEINQAKIENNNFWNEVYQLLQEEGWIKEEKNQAVSDPPAASQNKSGSNLAKIILFLLIVVAIYFIIKYMIRHA